MLMIRGLDLTTKEILLYGANMKLEKGFVYGLSARNGSGKTTLLRTISGLRKESTSSIMIIENDKPLDLINSKKEIFYYETSEWFDLNLSGLDYLEFIESSWKTESHMSLSRCDSFLGNGELYKTTDKKIFFRYETKSSTFDVCG